MNPDDIISAAFLADNLNGEGLFVVEGHPERNLFRILPADQAFKMNLNAFAYTINTGFQYMGIFTQEKFAQEFIDKIRAGVRDEEGKRLI